MRALVVTSNPATAVSEPDSPASALNDLGCEIVAVGYDIDQLPEDIELSRPSVVVVDAVRGSGVPVARAHPPPRQPRPAPSGQAGAREAGGRGRAARRLQAAGARARRPQFIPPSSEP